MSETIVTLGDQWRRKFRCISADPPWWETGQGKCVRGAQKHYDLMKTRDICALKVRGLPVADLAPADAHLHLWATNNHLKDAIEVGEAWGFRYISKVDWFKAEVIADLRPGGYVPSDLDELRDLLEDVPNAMVIRPQKPGLGQYFRGVTESCLFFVRGRLPYRTDARTGKRTQGRTGIISPRRDHSAKPPEQRAQIERVSAGPRLELFAVRDGPPGEWKVPGWTCWGPKSHRKSS